jgi:hypothetical protein
MEIDMANTIPEQNKALVLQAFDTLFNKRYYEAAARFWSDTYIQHSDHIAPGREGLFDLIRSAPDTLRYEYAQQSSDLWGCDRRLRYQAPARGSPPYRRAENLLATPHIGYVTRGLYERFYRDSAANISAWLDQR